MAEKTREFRFVRRHRRNPQNGRYRTGHAGSGRRIRRANGSVIYLEKIHFFFQPTCLKPFAFHRYLELRNRLNDIEVDKFFVTNRGQKISKIYEDVNKTCEINVSSCLFRKMVETKGIAQGTEVASMVAKALCHSDSTADVHYRMVHPDTAIRRHAAITRVDHTAIVDEFIKKK